MRRIVTAADQVDMLAPWLLTAAVDDRHPDLLAALASCGCVHTSNGRVMPQYRTAAADFTGPQDTTFGGFDDPAGWTYHKSFEPSQIARSGASAYASQMGMADPHSGATDYLNARRTPQSVKSIAQNYAALPTFDPSATKHFDALQDDVLKQHDFMTNRLGIKTQITDHDPYNDVHEMLHDVNNNHRLQVLGTHVTGGHPYIPDDVNDKFRAVHDLFGHAATGRSFDRHGEQAAYLAHSQMFSPAARPALATETRGQNSALIYGGGFQPQKTALIHPQFYSGPGAMHLSKLPKTQKCKYCKDQASKRILHSEGMAYIPTCDKHLKKGKDDAAACVPYGGSDPSNIVRVDDIKTAAYYTEDDMRHGPPPGTRPIVRHPDGSIQELADWVHQGGADTWPGKTTRERRDMWHGLGDWALDDADTNGLGHVPGDEYIADRTAAAADWTHDPEADSYTHPSGHVIKPSDEPQYGEGAYQLWTPTVGFGDRYPETLAKDHYPTPDLQKHFDWVDFTSGASKNNPYRKPRRKTMARRILTAAEQVDMLEPFQREAIRKGAPFAGYDDFDACTSENSDKRDPSAYCGEIKHRTEDKEASRWYVAVDTRGMDPESHAYATEEPPGPGPGRHHTPDTGWEPSEHDERQREAVGEDDDSGYNWGPEPRGVPESHSGQDRPTKPSAQWGADVMRHLDKNPWGVTVRDQIGDAPSSGYMVSHPGAEDEQSRSGLTPQKIREHYDRNFDLINDTPGNSYGGWDAPRTSESGKGGQPGWYHDVSQNIKDPAAAADAAVSGNQQAVYDLDNDQEISTPDMVKQFKGGAVNSLAWLR